jgi:hypothetical protein
VSKCGGNGVCGAGAGGCACVLSYKPGVYGGVTCGALGKFPMVRLIGYRPCGLGFRM